MWVHKGTCAFTQMGCKYKHMMPMDRETQVYMGLSDGIPSWFRHKYGLNMSGQPIRPPLTGGAPPLSALPPPSNYSMLPPPHSSLPVAPPHTSYGNRGGLSGGSWRRPAGALTAEPFNSPSMSSNCKFISLQCSTTKFLTMSQLVPVVAEMLTVQSVRDQPCPTTPSVPLTR